MADAQPIEISVIVPLLNEQDSIQQLYQRITKVLSKQYSYEIIFIDDGSTDQTAEHLATLTDQDSLCKAIYFKRNFGQTAAIMAGIEHSKGKILVPLDGDLQNPPEEIPKLIAKIYQGYDVCSGWRKNRKDPYWSRILPSFIANLIISKISGVKLHDFGCSLKAYKRDVLHDVKLYGEMHRFIPIYAHAAGAKITEVVVDHKPRIYGTSNYGIGRIFKVVLDLVVVKFLHSYAQKPIYVFGGFGLINFTLSLLVFIWMVYLKYWAGTSFITTPLPLLAALFILMGFISILVGLVAELTVRTYHESQNKPIYLVKSTSNFDSI